MLSLCLSFIFLLAGAAQAGKCKPVEFIMTRATGSSADYANGTWSTKFGLNGVNGASLEGSLYYVIAETIDKTAYSTDCQRKNEVQYIHFYKIVVCNPDEALWWFSRQRPLNHSTWPDQTYFGYGKYLTFDSGACDVENSVYCNALHGENYAPTLGSYVGAQSESTGVRNPTPGTHWYSLPGSCPSKDWSEKDDECVEEQPSGACAPGVMPDGVKCTYSYDLYGQINLDDLVGITSIVNEDTNANFTSAQEYCQAGLVEFERGSDFDFVDGLDFWKAPLNKTMNLLRIEKMVQLYNSQEDNLPLPTAEELLSKNPQCYETNPDCWENGRQICQRNNQMLCVACDGECGGNVDPAKAITGLKSVPVPELPTTAPGNMLMIHFNF